VRSFTRRATLATIAGAPVLASGWSAWADPAPPSIEALTQKPLVRSAALSPDGKHIAIIKQAEEGKQRQSFIDLIDADDPGLKRVRVPLGDLDVQRLSWGADDRFLVSVLYDATVAGQVTGSAFGERDYSLKLARTVAMGLDGGDQVVLFGKEKAILSLNTDLTAIVDLLPEDPDRVLMRAADPREYVWGLYYVDIHDGSCELIERGNLGTTWWWTEKGKPVLRQDAIGNGRVEALYSRPVGETVWKFVRKVRRNELDKPDFEFLAPTDAANVWLVSTAADTDTAKTVHKFDLATGALGDVVLAHADRDIENCLIDSRRNLVAAAYGDDRIGYEFADRTLAPHFKGVNTFFGNDSNVELVDVTPDHNRLLALVSSPTDRGGYYFYDRAAHRLQGLDMTHPWLASAQLARMEMLDVKARDGQMLRAYLTVPLAAGPRPLVVMPHGGPELRDSYQFDLFAQTFAAQGWMVLQPNFRGSGGYGRAFAEAGHLHWGDLMQQDIDDAVDQVVASGRVDPARVAIWGASYGGYAALMGAIRRPTFYRCAVSLAGIADVATMLEFDKKDDPDGLVYAYEIKRMGDPKKDAELIAAESPVTHVAAIKAPVLLMHGTKDKNVDPGQSREMANALRGAGKTFTYVELQGAGHHMNEWTDKHLKTILNTSIDFIGKSLA
jgi:dipeptidyl aminopeptidase/acylaminoacyl peptidase